jgi:metal-responsive CopG/Arc/MetJ family transcriptional regulator
MHPNSESGAAVQVRLTGSEFDALENWRRAQSKIPPRSEVIREAVRRFVKQQAFGAADQRGSATENGP